MQRCEGAEAVLNKIYEAFEQGDPKLFERQLANGANTVVIGTDPANVAGHR